MPAIIPDVDLLMLGKTGTGKSALGNAILKRTMFVSDYSSESVTTESNFEFTEFNGRIIKIVDGPGVGDTRLNTPDALKMVIRAMEAAMVANPRGYHAFLLVVKFGGRFTAEDKDTIQFLKTIFGGDDFVSRYCILVMTYGDDFERQRARGGGRNEDFDAWCQRQGGVFKDLLQEVGNRIVLFDNFTADEDKKNAQINRLLTLVDGLHDRCVRYKDAIFHQAQAAREKAVVESGKPEIREEVLQETSLILQKLDEIREKFQNADQTPLLEKLLERCNTFLVEIREKDQGTGALNDLKESLSAVQHSITDAIRAQNAILEERRRLEDREKHMQAEMKKHLRKQREEFDELINAQKKTEDERRQMEEELAKEQERLEEVRRKEMESKEKELMDLLLKKQQLLQVESQKLQMVHDANKSKPRREWWARTIGFIADNSHDLLDLISKMTEKGKK